MALSNSRKEFENSQPDVHAEQRGELLEGLTAVPRRINPKFFYDERGSELFSRICELEEYYPTRTEIGIFRDQSADIARAIGPDCELVEPGAGACEKVRYLLADLQPGAYLPLDISGEFLLMAARELQSDFPDLDIRPVVADFSESFELPDTDSGGRRVLFYPGSTIGNFEPSAALAFLRRAADLVGEGGGLLIGVDLHKDSAVLEAAYNDRAGVTAEFNRNILHHVNRLLDAEFDPERFAHVAFYNAAERRIEMHLESAESQSVLCNGETLEIAAGERIHTEFSYKYRIEDFARLADAAGFALHSSWVDEGGLFSVHYYRAA